MRYGYAFKGSQSSSQTDDGWTDRAVRQDRVPRSTRRPRELPLRRPFSVNRQPERQTAELPRRRPQPWGQPRAGTPWQATRTGEARRAAQGQSPAGAAGGAGPLPGLRPASGLAGPGRAVASSAITRSPSWFQLLSPPTLTTCFEGTRPSPAWPLGLQAAGPALPDLPGPRTSRCQGRDSAPPSRGGGGGADANTLLATGQVKKPLEGRRGARVPALSRQEKAACVQSLLTGKPRRRAKVQARGEAGRRSAPPRPPPQGPAALSHVLS